MTKKICRTILRLFAGAALAVAATAASAQDQSVTIGHFGNPTPFQIAVADGMIEEATGWDVEFRQFASGTDVIAAMASGDIKLAELGSSPLAIAASQGVDLQLFAIAQGIGKAESLAVRDGSGIEAPEDLTGKRVAVPVGSTAHFSLMGALQHWGIDPNDVTVMNMPPDQIAAAWSQDAVDAAFIWQPVQARILENGTRLTDAGEVAGWGFPTFDGWVVASDFAAENPEFVKAFVDTLAQVNQTYLDDPSAFTPDSEPVRKIASRTGAEADQIPGILEGFTFLTPAEMASDTWLGGTAPDAMKATAEFLREAGRIDAVADDYSAFVNADFVSAQ